MTNNKENWIQHTMETLDERMVEEYVKEYRASEYEARKALAEMYYDDMFERHSVDIDDKSDSENKDTGGIIGFVQY